VTTHAQSSRDGTATASIPVRVTIQDYTALAARVAALAQTATDAPAPSAAAPRWYALHLAAPALAAPATFDVLLAPRALHERLQPLPYQLRVVQSVLRDKAPGAILADEVGLGKTIEAGLVYKELALRGIVRSALILAPKALLGQWQEELRERFDADFVLTDEARFQGFALESRVICSLPQFVRSFEKVGARSWDLLVVDEAHLLANLQAKRRRYVAELRTRWRLLLTATPVANKVTDLYSLVDLVVPGRLGTPRAFETEYVADRGTARRVRPERVEQLRAVTGGVMCRTRRVEAEIAFSGRRVITRSIAPLPGEDSLIDDVTAYLRALYRRLPPAQRSTAGRSAAEQGGASTPATGARLNRGAVIREILALQQSLSSSPQASERSLLRRAETHPEERGSLLELAARCQQVHSAKEQLLLETLGELGGEPALVFTLRLETAARLRDLARAQGRSAECYVGALSRAEREALVARFNAGDLNLLIATDAGAEGLNLQQRCHVVVNYDLHWNPMRIEQRIGRVHRLGQQREVVVCNFALRDTIDDYVLQLLYEKISLFTLTIGALETILAETQDAELDVEERILDALLRGPSRDAVRHDIESIGVELLAAMDSQRLAETLTREVLG
jgi:SNF2 family DNA or RNA helicase